MISWSGPWRMCTTKAMADSAVHSIFKLGAQPMIAIQIFNPLGQAEQRVVAEMTELNKPFIVVLNSCHPEDEETLQLAVITFLVPISAASSKGMG